MGCVHGRPSASSPDRPPPPPEPAPAAPPQEAAGKAEQPAEKPARRQRRSRSSRPAPVGGSFANRARGEQVAAGWPAWLSAVAGEAIDGWTPRRADSFEKIDKIGQGTYSNVYKARDTVSGKIVALKKVRFDNLEPESVRFMAREILILRRLDHPNVVKLDGLVTSRMSCSLYLVFEYMEHDLAGLAASPDIKFTEPQVKCYMHQLLSGLEHCHDRGVLHRDIKGSNLLLDNNGMLKIADFGLASFFDPDRKQPMTSRVVTLWYRPPELLLGATDYGVGVDLWSAGCILAELLAGSPIMPGRTEVEQLHKIFKLCGSPTEEYWKKSKLPHATIFKPQQPYKRRIRETFKDFPQSALQLIETLLAIDPADRLTATAALRSDFFTTEPFACETSSLPKYPPSKEIDAKRRDEEARRFVTLTPVSVFMMIYSYDTWIRLGGWRIAYPIRIGYGYALDTPRIRFEPYPKKSDTYRLGYEYPTRLGRVFERETGGRREEVRGGGAAAGGWAPSTAAEARHSACASRRRAAGWPRRQRGADRELAGGAAVRRSPDLGLPSLAALALLPSPEREGGGLSPERLGVAGGWAPRPRAR